MNRAYTRRGLLKLNILLLIVLIMCSSCARPNNGATKTINNPNLLLEAESKIKDNKYTPFWQKGIKGINCVLALENSALSLKNTIFQARYRIYSEGKGTRFALLMPQGTKFGQCIEKNSELSCQNLKVRDGGDIMNASFQAVNELFHSAPSDGGKYQLQSSAREGNALNADEKDITVLREKSYKKGVITALYNLEGKPVSILFKQQNELVWKIDFTNLQNSTEPKQAITYFYKHKKSAWGVNVKIMEEDK